MASKDKLRVGVEDLAVGLIKFKDGLQIMRMLDAIYESAETGKEAAT